MALARHPGEVLSKTELLDEVWPEVVVGDASLSVAVAELRDALGDDPTRPQFIETIPRRGYRLMAPIMSTVDPPTAADSTPSYRLVGEDATYPLRPGRTTVGRDAGCGIRLESRLVSRVHAAFEVMDGRVVVEDLGSRNGTFVEGRRISGPTELRPGERVRLGRHAATLQLTSESASTWTELSAVEGLDL